MDPQESGTLITDLYVKCGRGGFESATLEQVREAVAPFINLVENVLYSTVKDAEGNKIPLIYFNDWFGVSMHDPSGEIAVSASDRLLFYTGNRLAISWQSGEIFDHDDVLCLNWLSRSLKASDDQVSVDWEKRQLLNEQGLVSVTFSGEFDTVIHNTLKVDNIQSYNTAGLNVTTATGSKLSFHGATPVIQRANASQDAVVTTTPTTGAYGYTQAQATAVLTLLNEIRTVLVEKGLMKGSA